MQVNFRTHASVARATPAACAVFGLAAACAVLGLANASASAQAPQRLSLPEAITQALNSPQAQVAAAHVDEARGLKRQAGLTFNPRLFLASEDFRPWADDFSFPTQAEDYGYLSETFELDGKRHRRVALADAQLHQREAEAALLRAQIAGRVAGAYWNAVALGQVAALLAQDMTAVDEMVRYHKERVDAGAMRGVDLLRMQIERDRLEVALRTAQRDAEQARLELFRQMGRAPQAGVVLADVLTTPPAVAPVPLATVLAQRPDVHAAQEGVTAAEADVRLQHANAVPNVDLLGGYKRNGALNTGYGALQIDLPLRNRNQGEIERANAGVIAAKAYLAALQLQIKAEVDEAEANYKQAQEIVNRLLPDMQQKARENLDLLTQAYRIGGVDLLRYLDAERTEFDVEVSALRTLAELQQAALRLQLSYGVQP